MFDRNRLIYWLVSLLLILIGFTARSYRIVAVQTFVVALCYVAAKRYLLGVPYHLAPEALGRFLDGIAVVLADFLSFLIGSSLCWGMAQWWRRRPHPTVHDRARQKIERARGQAVKERRAEPS
ncbi:MAG TPA: hypothetical protein VFR19_20230 [Hyphomicrobiaceae bacterium]|jgi:hypothetical protein|nr:hypothetical protein [Hyphomicrobiaceae bacterium]